MNGAYSISFPHLPIRLEIQLLMKLINVFDINSRNVLIDNSQTYIYKLEKRICSNLRVIIYVYVYARWFKQFMFNLYIR